MTNTEPRIASHADRTLHTDDQLRLTLEDLLQSANLAQLWLIFLDDESRLTGPLMPGDGYPDDPSDLVETTDLGSVTVAEVLGARLRTFSEILSAGSVVLVWERPGADRLSTETAAWVRAMADACRGADVAIRAQFLLHDKGLRMLVPDDYV